ncbi:MAG: hypothetical protein AUF67_03200 [Acidobacteria bacterium 13_1_20CM_58_21]|nr:MAG: hypothetical protein AUF67_03200 [Acidobacteria bacterium 13_1_20CM_58_21]
MVKSLKHIEKAWFPVSQFSPTAGFRNPKSMYNPGSTIKFREMHANHCTSRLQKSQHPAAATTRPNAPLIASPVSMF